MKNKYLTTTIALVLVVGILVVAFSFNMNTNKELTVYKAILKANSDTGEISLTEQMADAYYVEAGFFYEKHDYGNVESSCRLARTAFSETGQVYRQISSELENLEIDDELIALKIESFSILAETQGNLYEACEYFESAVRYYDVYYNGNVSYDDTSYDMGTGEINKMNEKIRLHDENIGKYNRLLSDFNTKLEARLN